MDATGPEYGVGLLQLPNEILLQVFEQLDSADLGIFAISTLARRLHYLALPIYLAAYGISDASALAAQDLVLSTTQLDVLGALQTALFISSVKHISCSFALNSARQTYSARDMDNFFRYIRRLAGFLSNLDTVDEVTLNFQDLNFWVIGESLSVLETWASAISTLLDVIVQKRCQTLKVAGGMFIVHSSQFQRKPGPHPTMKRWSVMSDIHRRFGSAFVLRPESQRVPYPARPQPGLRTFNINSRVLLLHPCYSWTIATLRTSPNLISLSIIRVDIPERNWDDILSSIHAPTLEHFCMDLSCSIKAAAFDRFIVRHPSLKTLTLGRDLRMSEDEVSSKDCLRNLTDLAAAPTFVRFLMADKRAPAVRNVRLLVKVTTNAIFKTETLNDTLAACHARLERVHLTLVIAVDYISSHWTGFFPDEGAAPPKKRGPDSLRRTRALEMVSACPSDAFEALALRWLPSFPALESTSFAGCLSKGSAAPPFVRQVREACPKLELVTVDGEKYGATHWGISASLEDILATDPPA
ncbi:hypothetical protein C8R47DRAFT_1089041 [Mycena vitilis]|nr:hypothetical protein C8R47DRAFT_1089041 [Mycena vitilis]